MGKIFSFEGGSGFGKTTMIDKFEDEVSCSVYSSISKDIYKRINNKWVNPTGQFSDMFYNIRVKQYLEIKNNQNNQLVLFDRFLFFPIAMRIFSKMKIPTYYYKIFEDKCPLDGVFIFEPIPINEYKNGYPRKNLTYKESLAIHDITIKVIEQLGYKSIIVPFDTIENRYQFVKNRLLDS